VRRALANVSLRNKLVALCCSLVVGVSAILLFELPRAMDVESRGWIVSRSLALGRLMASAVEAAVDFEDTGSAQNSLDGLERSRGAIYALLVRADGSTFARWGAPGPRLPTFEGDGEASSMAEGILHVRVPVATRSGRGALLFLGFKLDELEERRAEARASVLRATGFALVAGLLFALLIGSLLSRPLLRMTEAAKGVAAGDEAAARHLPLDRHDEIGALAQAFARMLERLYEQRGQIRAINADLALRVQERTAELARTNEALSELARTQEQLVLADRRVSVGRLAAGVAHEVNNPLTFLRGNLDFVAHEMPQVQAAAAKGDQKEVALMLAEMAGAVGDARQGALRVTHIVRGLKTFARDDDDRREVLSLESPMEAAIEMAFHEIKHRAQLVRSFGPAPRVCGNEVRLSQVFLNLLLNAAQAIPEGAAKQHQIRCLIGTDGSGRAVASVEDTGCGMSPELQARIFDPFFTTKPVGVGSGLGLSISRNIVEQLGGTITVESAPDLGTTFKVTLPPASPEALAAPQAVRPAESAPAVEVSLRGLRILVVDDEPLVGATVERALSEGEVTSVQSAAEALERIERGESYDRILCDVMMPEMSGPELYLALGRLAPDLQRRVVFMTGGAFTEGAQAFVNSWRGPLIHKPFESAVLRRFIYEALT